jgi:Lipocalin-like domain
MMTDSDLRQALLGIWRIVSFQADVNGTTFKPFGDDPVGYLIFTPHGRVFVQFAARERPDLFAQVPSNPPRGPVLRETTEANTAIGFIGYCGKFEVRDRQLVNHLEFSYLRPSANGSVETRSVKLDGDRLILSTPYGHQLEWQRIQSEQSR